jgi:hypothetical protein
MDVPPGSRVLPPLGPPVFIAIISVCCSEIFAAATDAGESVPRMTE